MRLRSDKSSQGYTLLEILIVFGVVGILSAIATPSWLAFLNRLRLNAAQNEAHAIIREAQANAKREKRVWEACFREDETGKKVQWSVHRLGTLGGQVCENANWQNLIGEDADKIAIDTISSSYTTLYPYPQRSIVYLVQFQYNGWANGRRGLGKITFVTRNQNSSSRRCVVVSTLLGAMRTERNRKCDR